MIVYIRCHVARFYYAEPSITVLIDNGKTVRSFTVNDWQSIFNMQSLRIADTIKVQFS